MNKPNFPVLTAVLLVTLLPYSCTSFSSSSLMSWEDYARQPRSEPYILNMDSRDGSLVYYGAFHKVDPSHPQFQDIEQKWENFKPTLAYCEGILWPLEKTRTNAIRNYGEQGLITYLAARDGIQIECIDPTLTEQAIYLKKSFPPHLVKVYYVMRQAAIDRMLKRDFNAAKCADRYLRKFRQIEGYENLPNNFREYKKLVSILFPGLDEWEKVPYFYFHHQESGDFLARIHKKLNSFRDQIMINKIVKALKRGQRIFAIVGRSHVVIQEAALVSLSSPSPYSSIRNSKL